MTKLIVAFRNFTKARKRWLHPTPQGDNIHKAIIWTT